MSAITVGEDLIHYEVLGRLRPVILVHGWVGSWRYWIPTMQQLHMKYRVYALDLFGYGDSSKAPARYTVQQQVDMLDEFMDQLAIPRAAFIGHGLGAMIVAEFAFKYQKKRVPRAMLISSPLFDIGDLENRMPKRISRANKRDEFFADDPDRTIPSGSLEATIPSAGMMRAALLERAAARNRSSGKIPSPISSGESKPPTRNLLAESLGTDDIMALLERCFRRTEVEFGKLQGDVLNADSRAIEASIRDFDAGKMLDTVQQLEMPTVLIHGNEDPLVPAPSGDVWDYVTGNGNNALAIPLPNVRHFPMLEHDRFGRLINDFLETDDVNKLEVKERWRRRSR